MIPRLPSISEGREFGQRDKGCGFFLFFRIIWWHQLIQVRYKIQTGYDFKPNQTFNMRFKSALLGGDNKLGINILWPLSNLVNLLYRFTKQSLYIYTCKEPMYHTKWAKWYFKTLAFIQKTKCHHHDILSKQSATKVIYCYAKCLVKISLVCKNRFNWI